MIKKLISLVLTVVMMLCCIVVPASAAVIEDETVSPYYTYASSVKSTLTISSKTATCKSIVTGISGTTTKIVITQRLNNSLMLID